MPLYCGKCDTSVIRCSRAVFSHFITLICWAQWIGIQPMIIHFTTVKWARVNVFIDLPRLPIYCGKYFTTDGKCVSCVNTALEGRHLLKQTNKQTNKQNKRTNTNKATHNRKRSKRNSASCYTNFSRTPPTPSPPIFSLISNSIV